MQASKRSFADKEALTDHGDTRDQVGLLLNCFYFSILALL